MGQPRHTEVFAGEDQHDTDTGNGGNGGGGNNGNDEEVQWGMIIKILTLLAFTIGTIYFWGDFPWWKWPVLLVAILVIGWAITKKPSAPKGMHIPADAFVKLTEGEGKISLGEGLWYITRSSLTGTNKGRSMLQIGDTVFSAGLLGHPVVLVMKKAHTFTVKLEVTSTESGPYFIVIKVRVKPKFENGEMHPTAVKQLASYRSESESWQSMIDEVVTALLQPFWANKPTDYVLSNIELKDEVVTPHTTLVADRLLEEFGLELELFNYEGVDGAKVVQATEDAGALQKQVDVLAPLLGGGGNGNQAPQSGFDRFMSFMMLKELGLFGNKKDKQ